MYLQIQVSYVISSSITINFFLMIFFFVEKKSQCALYLLSIAKPKIDFSFFINYKFHSIGRPKYAIIVEHLFLCF